ncbi:hypothetical protein HKX69_06970 [Streptomyces argyrophyllae]|uniref:Uncharacterized protein n=1 Tax=Streptomyces argyrophylli TaxID=2726118 RepID=A0A6M4PFN9_9ACTN|nr:hypothetical protein HKX69_06970 [Streptomyces argyrophyllae]
MISASFTWRDHVTPAGAGRGRTGVPGRPWRPAASGGRDVRPPRRPVAGPPAVRIWPNHRSSGMRQDCPGACWASIPP